jgi:hypothetical protein
MPPPTKRALQWLKLLPAMMVLLASRDTQPPERRQQQQQRWQQHVQVYSSALCIVRLVHDCTNKLLRQKMALGAATCSLCLRNAGDCRAPVIRKPLQPTHFHHHHVPQSSHSPLTL